MMADGRMTASDSVSSFVVVVSAVSPSGAGVAVAAADGGQQWWD